MERVKFSYGFEDEEYGHNKNVQLEIVQETLDLQDVCEMFEDFITSAGFSIDGVLRYFRK